VWVCIWMWLVLQNELPHVSYSLFARQNTDRSLPETTPHALQTTSRTMKQAFSSPNFEIQEKERETVIHNKSWNWDCRRWEVPHSVPVLSYTAAPALWCAGEDAHNWCCGPVAAEPGSEEAVSHLAFAVAFREQAAYEVLIRSHGLPPGEKPIKANPYSCFRALALTFPVGHLALEHALSGARVAGITGFLHDGTDVWRIMCFVYLMKI
jgi:hypothetical protein